MDYQKFYSYLFNGLETASLFTSAISVIGIIIFTIVYILFCCYKKEEDGDIDNIMIVFKESGKWLRFFIGMFFISLLGCHIAPNKIQLDDIFNIKKSSKDKTIDKISSMDKEEIIKYIQSDTSNFKK